ncbi:MULTISPECIES: hypothetical protein [Campylobacter]|uniref:hypothetical protein n=1 Tax=Campylobacter TaxID=194 RepID=UPI0023F371C4|nr:MULTISPECIES: hypothetical protein [Campylobacter]MCI6641462.1 hypothetical protein [Campylobacter sp.]MDD7422142.1 hypothetical protein [Campylobacter hominis]MDY3117803.1 hypothetical protein [Campylobacter hominis]
MEEKQSKQQEKNQWADEKYVTKQRQEAYLYGEIEKEKAQTKEAFVKHHLNNANNNLNKDAKEAIEILKEKEKIDEQIREKETEFKEFKGAKPKREFVKDKLDSIDKNADLKESLDILREKEKIEELIKEKEQQIEKEKTNTNGKKADNKIYKIIWEEDTGGDNYGVVEESKLKGSKEEILKYYKEHQNEESTRKDAYGNILESKFKIYDEKGENVTNEFKKELEELKNKDKTNSQDENKEKGKENSTEQDDWDKRAKELELQHEKELEDLKDKQSRLEANFQKSIDNLMNSDGIGGIITALQEMDRSMEMMLKQGKEESEQKDKQRKEKLELAFESPKFREAVGDLVKEVYDEQKKVKGGLKEMEKEYDNYTKLQEAYKKEVKKGIDKKGYEKLQKMVDKIDKDTPKFKENYPKFYKKVTQTLEQTKEQLKNKNQEQDKGRDIQ